MKLNFDCIRDILLLVEMNSTFDDEILINYEDSFIFSNYSNAETCYHIRQCEMSGLIVGVNYFDDSIAIADLSPKGHEFLSNIRENTFWNKTKNIASKLGTSSLNALVQISSNIVTALIKSEFGIT